MTADRLIFASIAEVQQIPTERFWNCKNERPKLANGGMTPARKLNTAAWLL